MSSPEIDGVLATQLAVEIRASPLSRQSSDERSRHHALELKLAALQSDYARLYNELVEAAQVHRRLSAPRLVRQGNFEIASEIFAVRQVPGDFVTIEESSGRVILALGDIGGKGLAAGMWTTHLVGLVATHTASNSEPHAIVTGVNRELCRMSPAAPLTSLFLATLEADTGVLHYCNAGHPPALLSRANGQLELLSEGGLLLGVLPGASFAMGRVELRVGDVLVICSDGILESLNNVNQEFGYERLVAQLRRARTGSADALLFSVLGAVQDFAATHPLVDDMSLVVVGRCTQQ